MKIIYNEKEKERLDKFLQTQLKDISRSQIKKLILNGSVKVNDKEPTVHHWLKEGDNIEYTEKKNTQIKETITVQPKIIEQNENYLIIDKPHNLLVHATDRGETNTLADWLVSKFPGIEKIGDDPLRPGIVHRLDKEVSGLMVIPLNQDYFDLIKKQFQDRTIKKEYLALVHGKLINNKGEINNPLERDKKTGLMKVQTVKKTGRTALTIYEIVKKYISYTLVKVQIKTGRTHQIRAHFYSIGHSLIGDKLYKTKDIRKKKKVLEQRIFLHAHYLAFKDHDEKLQEYHSELPSKLIAFLNTIK